MDQEKKTERGQQEIKMKIIKIYINLPGLCMMDWLTQKEKAITRTISRIVKGIQTNIINRNNFKLGTHITNFRY